MRFSCLLPLLFLAACSMPASAPSSAPATTQQGLHGDGTLPAESTGHGLRFEVQPGWIEQTAANSMRKVQCRLPGESGQDASLIVYYFGPDMASAEVNIERWATQFEQPDGSDSMASMSRSTRMAGGLAVNAVALSGTFVAETAPGSGVRVREEGWSMHAAIIESDHGPYYVKLVGPQATVERWAGSYDDFVNSVSR